MTARIGLKSSVVMMDVVVVSGRRCGGEQDQKLEQEHEVLGARSNGR